MIDNNKQTEIMKNKKITKSKFTFNFKNEMHQALEVLRYAMDGGYKYFEKRYDCDN